jgi:hypothetical protein
MPVPDVCITVCGRILNELPNRFVVVTDIVSGVILDVFEFIIILLLILCSVKSAPIPVEVLIVIGVVVAEPIKVNRF